MTPNHPSSASLRVSVVIPALAEEQTIADAVRNAFAAGADEVIVADGGSEDRTAELAEAAGVRVVQAPRGRGTQQNGGAAAASGDVLCFLHADVRLTRDAVAAMRAVLSDRSVVGGNFSVRFGGSLHGRFLAAFYYVIRQLGVYYGDSTIFCRREAFEAVGGFPPYPLMEDMKLVSRLRRVGRMGLPRQSRRGVTSPLGAGRHRIGVGVVAGDPVALLVRRLAVAAGDALPAHSLASRARRRGEVKTESIYWVYTHNCNLKCAHCYNFSRPGAPTISRGEADAVLANLPEETNRFILSGGEPLVELEMGLYLLAAGRERYPDANVSLQTNGDLLDAPTLERLLATGLNGIAICSLDVFHPRPDGKFETLRELMSGQGMVERKVGDPSDGKKARSAPTFSIWGASPELWVGGLWPRGRAMKYGLAQLAPEHNFCDRWSGALGFLDNGTSQQEVAIQLTTVYPCCPGTVEPLGDLSREPLETMLDRYRDDPVWQALNAGDPASMGVAAGFDREYAERRIEELGSVCLWCDEFFTEQAKLRGQEVAPLPLMGELAGAEL